MADDDPAAVLAREATAALRKLDEAGQTVRAVGGDRFAGSADVLDELARVAEALGWAVENTSGKGNDTIRDQVSVLSRLITEHRNSLLRHSLGGAPQPVYDRGAGASKRPRPLAQRLMAQEWADRHNGHSASRVL